MAPRKRKAAASSEEKSTESKKKKSKAEIKAAALSKVAKYKQQQQDKKNAASAPKSPPKSPKKEKVTRGAKAPSAKKPSAKKPSTKKPSAKKPSVKKSPAKSPVRTRSTRTRKSESSSASPTKKPSAKKPSVRKPPAKSPARARSTRTRKSESSTASPTRASRKSKDDVKPSASSTAKQAIKRAGRDKVDEYKNRLATSPKKVPAAALKTVASPPPKRSTRSNKIVAGVRSGRRSNTNRKFEKEESEKDDDDDSSGEELNMFDGSSDEEGFDDDDHFGLPYEDDYSYDDDDDIFGEDEDDMGGAVMLGGDRVFMEDAMLPPAHTGWSWWSWFKFFVKYTFILYLVYRIYGKIIGPPAPPPLEPPPCFIDTSVEEAEENTPVAPQCQGEPLDNWEACPAGAHCAGGVITHCTSPTGYYDIAPGKGACVVSAQVNKTMLAMHQSLHDWTVQHLCKWLPGDDKSHTPVMGGNENGAQPIFRFGDVSRALTLSGDIGGNHNGKEEMYLVKLTRFMNKMDTKFFAKKITGEDGQEVLYVGLLPTEKLKMSTFCKGRRFTWNVVIILLVWVWFVIRLVSQSAWDCFITFPIPTTITLLAAWAANTFLDRRLRRREDLETHARDRRLVREDVCEILSKDDSKRHDSLEILEEIMWKRYPCSRAGRARVRDRIWKQIIDDVEEDERISVRKSRRRILWQWSGPPL